MSLVFIFKNIPILLLSVELQLDREGLRQQKDESASEVTCDTQGRFSEETEESLSLGIFRSEIFWRRYFWKFRFSLV